MSETAWGYYAVSSAPQESTLADQEIWAQRVASENGWKITRSFSVAATGKRGVRRHLAELIAELRATPKQQRPAWILMLRLDRFGRGSAIDSQIALREILDLGPRVWTGDQGEAKLESGTDEIIAAVRFGLARIENEIRRSKSLAFHARKRAAGEWASTAAYGFVLVDKRLAAYEPEAAIIREIFQRRIGGWGYQRIAMHVAAIAPGKMRPNGQRRAIGWSQSTVATMLKNPAYRGTLVSEALWDAAAALRGRIVDRRAPRWPWPLRGAVRCTCGGQLFGEASGRDGARTRYYVCRRVVHHGGRFPHHNAQRLERQFVALLGRLEASPELAAAQLPAPAETAALRQRRAEIGRQRSALERRRARAWEIAEEGRIGGTDLAARLQELTTEDARLTALGAGIDDAIAAAETRGRIAHDVAEVIRGAAALWQRMDQDSQRRVARAVGACVGGLWADPLRPAQLLLNDASGKSFDTLRNVDMAQRKADDSITKKFIQSITE